MLKKLFLTFIALVFILFGSLILMMGYVFNNPEKVFSAFNTMADKFMQSQDYKESEDFFIQGFETLRISSQRVDISVFIYNGISLKVLLHGKVPHFDSGPYILQTSDRSTLNVELHEPLASHWVQWNINGQEVTKESDSELKADIYVPESFKKSLSISTKSGSVLMQIPPRALYELNLQSVAGTIKNDFESPTTKADLRAEEVGRIEISTERGSITVKPL